MTDVTHTQWECFHDLSYFDMWCVRPTSDRRFGAGFHVLNEKSAEPLRDYLNEVEAAKAELLEALEKATDSECQSWCEKGAHHRAICTERRALIAKARGQS